MTNGPGNSAAPSRPKTRTANLLLLGGTTAACLLAAELVLARRYPQKAHSVPVEVREVQKHLKLHPTLGFTWKEHVPFTAHILLAWSDTEPDPLSTDEYGVINCPDALEKVRSGEPIDVIGVGDSFMEHGSFLFYEIFERAGLTYYNMAISRHSPPQYNVMLRDYALPRMPKWVVYGVFENDFEETADFEDWTRSGLDWFTFHSGTWFGRPQNAGAGERFFRRYLPGSYGAYRRARKRLEQSSAAPRALPPVDPTGVLKCIRAANEAARAQGVGLLLVLIPSKRTATGQTTRESIAYDVLLRNLDPGGYEILDLRARFSNSADPLSLYYRHDPHWNRNGIRAAAAAILERLSPNL